MVPFGTKVCDFCGATQLGDCSPTRRRANTRLSLVTGEKPVGAYWGEIPFSPPSAVHSAGPLLRHPTTGSSLEKRRPCTRPRHWFVLLNLG